MKGFTQENIINTLVGFKHYIKNPISIGLSKDSIKSISTSKELGNELVYIFNADKIQSVYNLGIEKFNTIKFENIEDFTNEKYFDKKILSIAECDYNIRKIDCIFSLVDLPMDFRNLFFTYYKLKHLVWNSVEDIKDNLIEFNDEAYRYNIALISIDLPIKHTSWRIIVKQDRADIKFHTHIISVINQISKRMNGYCSMKLIENAYTFYIHHIDPSLITPTWKLNDKYTIILPTAVEF